MKYKITMHVAGGKLANGLEYNIPVEFDFTGLTLEQCHALLIDSSSPRVKLATRLRNMKPETLEIYQRTGGYTQLVSELGVRAARVNRPPTREEALDTLANLPRDEYVDFMMDNGLTEELAIISYNRKHGIVNPT